MMPKSKPFPIRGQKHTLKRSSVHLLSNNPENNRHWSDASVSFFYKWQWTEQTALPVIIQALLLALCVVTHHAQFNQNLTLLSTSKASDAIPL